jgi:hypothetical protein
MQKGDFSYRYVSLSTILYETGLTSKMMRNNQIRAFWPIYTSAKTTALSRLFFPGLDLQDM